VSRIPRTQEHFKTAFIAEAASAARFRAYAARAERDAFPNLARHWLELAAAKDALALLQLEAAGQVRGEGMDLDAAIAEERYENEILYPKLIHDSEAEAAAVFRRVVEAQQGHRQRLEALAGELQAAVGDVPAASRGVQ
jgi:rubrerythrin